MVICLPCACLCTLKCQPKQWQGLGPKRNKPMPTVKAKSNSVLWLQNESVRVVNFSEDQVGHGAHRFSPKIESVWAQCLSHSSQIKCNMCSHVQVSIRQQWKENEFQVEQSFRVWFSLLKTSRARGGDFARHCKFRLLIPSFDTLFLSFSGFLGL